MVAAIINKTSIVFIVPVPDRSFNQFASPARNPAPEPGKFKKKATEEKRPSIPLWIGKHIERALAKRAKIRSWLIFIHSLQSRAVPTLRTNADFEKGFLRRAA